MPAHLALVPSRPAAPAVVRTRALDRELARFEPRVALRVAALARRHPALADLAESFPALLFALALPRLRLDVPPLIERAIDGERLDRLARDAGVAGWLRALPPEAFRQPIPVLPDSPKLRLRLANHRPRAPRHAALWLDSVVTAFDTADEDVAVWIASQLTGATPARPRNRRDGRPSARAIPHLQRICLWAWISRRPGSLHDRLLTSGRWNPDLLLRAAGERSYDWILQVQAAVDLGLDPPPAEAPVSIVIHGYQFVPLVLGADFAAESEAMGNCARDYADAVAENRCRLWSVRRDGARVATLETSVPGGEPWPRLVQLKARANTHAPLAIWQAARAFVEAQEQGPAWYAARAPRTAEDKQRTWLALWRPYWLAKRRIPSWLPGAYRGTWWL